MATLDGLQMRYVAMAESHHALRMAHKVGTVEPVHSTALGKAYLAAMEPEDARALARELTLARKTPRTIVDSGEFDREIERVRERGYATDDEENELGGRCIGAAIFDGAGHPVAAISVSGPLARMPDSLLPIIGAAVREAAQDIASAMGFAGPISETP